MTLQIILWFLMGMLAGSILARKNDILNMFRKGSDIRDKKVVMFLSVAVVIGTFSYSYMKAPTQGDGLLDVGWGWVVLIFLVIVGFLAPDALVKIGAKAAEAFAGKARNE